MEFAPEVIDHIRELHSSAKAESKRLKAAAEEAAEAEKCWDDFERFLVTNRPLHLMSLAEAEAPRLKKMRTEDHPAVPFIEEAYRLAKEESERIMRRYPALLEEASRAAGIVLDSNSPHPKYGLENGFLRVEIDERKRTARLSNHEGRLVEIPADVAAVVEAILREHKRIFGRPFNGSKFLKMLRAQYRALLTTEKQTDGASVPIRQITRRLGKNVKGFRTDEFLVDLSRLAEQGPFEIDGRRLDLQQTKDTNQGMLLHGAAARGYVGFVVFKEA